MMTLCLQVLSGYEDLSDFSDCFAGETALRPHWRHGLYGLEETVLILHSPEKLGCKGNAGSSFGVANDQVGIEFGAFSGNLARSSLNRLW